MAKAPIVTTPEQVLAQMESYLSNALKKGIIKLLKDGDDGRENSSKNERQLTHALQLQFEGSEWFKKRGLSIEIGKSRWWYDFLVKNEDESVWVPVNVKVSALQSADNVSSKEGLFYAITGVDPKDVRIPSKAKGKTKKVGINTWGAYCEYLAHFFGHRQDADYYFLVVNKADVGCVFWTSLKCMPALEANGNNLPFQANWSQNAVRKKRSFEKASKYLLDIFRESLVLRARALQEFDENLGTIHAGLK